jgi:Putative lumazine-binding
MQRLVLALTLSLLLFVISTRAQNSQTSSLNTPSEEATAISTTVRNYIEAYYTGDALRMKQTMHPHYLKHMIHGDIPMREKTAAQMEREVRSNGPADFPQADKTEQISVLDISGDIASAKLITPHWVDYMTLSKLDGQWKILSVVQRIDN